jgi:hypothetical protein
LVALTRSSQVGEGSAVSSLHLLVSMTSSPLSAAVSCGF